MSGIKHTQLSVSTELAPLETSVGTLLSVRDQNHTDTSVEVRCMAYQPPPAALKSGPKEFVVGFSTPHPSLPSVFTSQSVDCDVLVRMSIICDVLSKGTHPVSVRDEGIEHVLPTCKDTRFGDTEFTPSILTASGSIEDRPAKEV